MRLLLTIALYGVLAGLLATRPRADDIDIYRAAPGAGPTRLMFALDLRAGGNAILCSDALAASCEQALGAELYAGLDLFGPTGGDPGEPPVERSADGVADSAQPDPAGSAPSLAAGHWAGVPVDRYDALRSALRVVWTQLGERFGGEPGQSLQVGLMALHADTCAGAGPRFVPDYSAAPVAACSQGAYVLQGFTDTGDPAGLDKLLRALAALPDPGRRAAWMAAPWAGHPYTIRDVYLELHRYLTGQAVFNGFLGSRDYASQSSGNLYHDGTGSITNDVLLGSPDGTPGQPLLAPDVTIMQPSSLDLAGDRVSAARYISPIPEQEECPKVALVHLLYGAPSPSHPDTDAAVAAPASAGGLGLALAAGEAGDRALVARMAAGEAGAGDAVGVPVRSYFFTVQSSAASEAMAVAGGTGRAYSLADAGELIAALAGIAGAGSGPDSTLVAASMPVPVAAGERTAEDIYFALFRSEPGPPWPGNVKKLKLVRSVDAGQGGMIERELVAQAPLASPPRPALAADGRILPDALTFWTDPLAADVQAFDATREEVAGRDGRSVLRGGAGQQLSGLVGNAVGVNNSEPGARQIFTLDPDAPGELLGLDAGTGILEKISGWLDPAGRMSPEQGLALLRWIRGQDSLDEDGDGDLLESRRWLLGGVLHSRPLAINYGARPGTGYSAANPDIRLFFGTSDGVFHSVRNTAESGAESGREGWAFIPPALLAMQHSLAHAAGAAAGPFSYGLDGEAVAQIEDRDGDGNIEVGEGDFVRVFIGQRRGGRAIYAFDMSDPDRPRYLWTIDASSPGFEQLALTFSTPRVARLDLGGAAPTPALVFAGGYHGGWAGGGRIGKDAGAGPDLLGNAVYVVDPADGSLVWRAVGPGGGQAPAAGGGRLFVAGLTHSIPSPVTLVDSDRNGVDDRAYVGDSGGNVWRIELTEYARRMPGTAVSDPANWYLSRLAALGGSGDADRRFFHAPDVVHSRDGDGDYDGVLIVSGNRAAPRELAVRNFAYLLKDRRTAAGGSAPSAGATIGHDSLVDVTAACSGGATACAAPELAGGWRLELGAPGEKGLSSPLVSNGRVLFTSYVPFAADSPDPCTVSTGEGRVYGVALGNGSAALPLVENFTPGDESEPDSPATPEDRFRVIGEGIPGDVLPYRDGVLIPGAGLDGNPVVAVPGNTLWRAYWTEREVDTL